MKTFLVTGLTVAAGIVAMAFFGPMAALVFLFGIIFGTVIEHYNEYCNGNYVRFYRDIQK